MQATVSISSVHSITFKTFSLSQVNNMLQFNLLNSHIGKLRNKEEWPSLSAHFCVIRFSRFYLFLTDVVITAVSQGDANLICTVHFSPLLEQKDALNRDVSFQAIAWIQAFMKSKFLHFYFQSILEAFSLNSHTFQAFSFKSLHTWLK